MLESARFRLIEWLHVNHPGILCRTGFSSDPIPQHFSKQVLLSYQPETPFDNLESAHEYVGLLLEAIVEAESELTTDISAANESPNRRLEALRLIHYKLEKLE